MVLSSDIDKVKTAWNDLPDSTEAQDKFLEERDAEFEKICSVSIAVFSHTD